MLADFALCKILRDLKAILRSCMPHARRLGAEILIIRMFVLRRAASSRFTMIMQLWYELGEAGPLYSKSTDPYSRMRPF